MKEFETRKDKFRRLAKQRGDRLLNDIRVLGNLSNRNNYEYSDQDIKSLFGPIEEELRANKAQFTAHKKRKINL